MASIIFFDSKGVIPIILNPESLHALDRNWLNVWMCWVCWEVSWLRWFLLNFKDHVKMGMSTWLLKSVARWQCSRAAIYIMFYNASSRIAIFDEVLHLHPEMRQIFLCAQGVDGADLLLKWISCTWHPSNNPSNKQMMAICEAVEQLVQKLFHGFTSVVNIPSSFC